MTGFRSACCSIVVSLLVISGVLQKTLGEGQPAAAATIPSASADVVKQWQHRRFGMFIHWGPVSLKGTEIGWSRQGPRRGRTRGGTGTIPLVEYDNLYKQFNPVNFNPLRQALEASVFGRFTSECLNYRDGRQRLLGQRHQLALQLLLLVNAFRHRTGKVPRNESQRNRHRQ